MSRTNMQGDEEQSPLEKKDELDDDNNFRFKGFASIYQKKSSASNHRSRRCIALILLVLVFVFIVWNYQSANDKSDELINSQGIGWEKNTALHQQLHKLKDTKIQNLEASNQLLQKKVEQSNKEIQRLSENLNTEHSDSNLKNERVSSNLDRKNDIPCVEQSRFLVPKFVWLYLSRPANEENYVTQRGIENIKWYSQQSGFELRIVGRDNYGLWLNTDETAQLGALVKGLQEKRGRSQQLNSKFEKVRQTLIMLHLLHRFGGVLISKQYIFTEKLDWLESIKSNILINTGNPYTKPKVFAFLSLSDGSVVSKYKKKASIEVDKYFIIFPGPKDYFLAALAGTEYLTDVLGQYIAIVQNPNAIADIVNKEKITCGNMNVNDLNVAFTLASQIVIQRRQGQLNYNQDKYEGFYRKFAIDEYGLLTINSYYFPDKMWFYFTNRLRYFDNFFNYVAKMAQDQFEDSIGPMRFIANPDPHGEFNRRIESARDGKGYTIVEGSFMQRHLFMDKEYDFIQPNRQKRNTAVTLKKWDNLPKTLWLYWDSGSENAPVTNQLCILNLIKNAKEAGYDVQEVSDANAHHFIPQSTLDKISNAIKNSKMNILPQTKSDFFRLALISTYGGIYLDSSNFFLEDFTWITEVSKEPTKYFFNRFGDVPKVLMQFHPIQGGPFDWTVDETYNTKAAWNLAFESSFLAADKDSEFIKEWFQLFTFFVLSPYEVTEKKMRQCNMFSHKWTNNNYRYLTVMDSLKAVLGCKQADIDKNKQKYGGITHAADYYKLWGINGFTGIQKFRFYNNYPNAYRSIVNEKENEDPVLMYRYSQQYAQLVYGRVYKAIKLYGSNNIGSINELIISQRNNNFTLECHPESIFLRYLFNKNEYEFYQTNKLNVRFRS